MICQAENSTHKKLYNCIEPRVSVILKVVAAITVNMYVPDAVLSILY